MKCAGCSKDAVVIAATEEGPLCHECRPIRPADAVDCQLCGARQAVQLNRAAMVWFCCACGDSGHVILSTGYFDRRVCCRN